MQYSINNIFSHVTRWVVAYRDALSFRLSHYFVSHLSEASASLGGIETGIVSRAQHIELPRSLLSVVTYWNIPMHNFLKKCKLKDDSF